MSTKLDARTSHPASIISAAISISAREGASRNPQAWPLGLTALAAASILLRSGAPLPADDGGDKIAQLDQHRSRHGGD
jgi:hypothetical protein